MIDASAIGLYATAHFDRAGGEVYATGEIIAYSAVPQVLILEPSGRCTWWRADQCTLQPPLVTDEQLLAELLEGTPWT